MKTHLAIRVRAENPDHHLWNNNGTFWCHYTEHLSDYTKRRVRRSLRTADRAIARFNAAGGAAPVGLSALLIGGRELGEVLVDSPLVPLVSATGSTAMGRAVGPKVAARFGRFLFR